MIDLENLNNQGFDDIVETAKKQIAQLSNEWTNTQDSDPGITLIELFAWLKVVQHNYMNRISKGSEYKFLELLNIKQEKNRGAETLLQVSNVKQDIKLPKGTKWYVNDIDFENDDVQYITSANIKSVGFVNSKSKKVTNYDNFNGKRIFELFGDLADLKDSNEKASFCLNLDKPISKDSTFNLYFNIFLEDKYTRNPISEDDNFLEMSKTIWEFYGEIGGVLGWHPLRVVKDDTHRFLFSGIVSLRINGDMKQIDDNFYSIRVRLLDQDYDLPPRITDVKLNVFKVIQKSTLCENTMIKKNQISKSGHFSISNHLAIYGENQLYVKSENGWKIVDDFKTESQIEKNYASFYVEGVQEQIKDFDDEDEVLMLISSDKSIASKMILGSGTGSSSQRIKLQTKNILYNSFDLIVGYSKDGYEYFDKWEKVYDLYSSKKYDKHYVLNFEKESILFGDHEMGQAPRKGKNNIRLCGVATTKGKESNIRKGMIKNVRSENPIIKQLHINQIISSKDGRDMESFEDMKARASKLLTQVDKAVTLEDYQTIVKRTPGLIMQNIRILPSYSIKKGDEDLNSVTVVIRNKEQNHKEKTKLKSYEENIRRYMDKYRLINTKILVTGPVYIGLAISGQIVLNSYYRKNSDEVSRAITKFIDGMNETCGQTLFYGDLFGTLDRLDSVSYVDELHIIPSGEYLERTLSEDIVVPPNAIYYIEKLDLSYINSANM